MTCLRQALFMFTTSRLQLLYLRCYHSQYHCYVSRFKLCDISAIYTRDWYMSCSLEYISNSSALPTKR